MIQKAKHEVIQKSVRFECEPLLEPLHISAKQLFLNPAVYQTVQLKLENYPSDLSRRTSDVHATKRDALYFTRFASEQRGSILKKNKNLCLKDQASIWPRLCCVCHVRSTAADT